MAGKGTLIGDLRTPDAQTRCGPELMASVREMKAGQAGHVHRVPVSAITEARTRTGLSQKQFAEVLREIIAA
jgi:putative transcriptional regulator